jgi:hypothetical protein
MNRRKFVIGLGAASVSGSALTGSGAFTSTSADRSVSITTAPDDRAFLKLTERGAGRRSFEDGEIIGFDLPSPDEGDYGGTDPDGLGVDSVYRFGSDASQDEVGLFDVTNQGTQPVSVYSTTDADSDEPSVTMYNAETGNLLTEDNPYSALGVGDDPLICGIAIDTRGVAVQEEEFEITLSINAIAAESD